MSVASLGLVPLAFIVGPSNGLVDLALGIVYPIHCHLGFQAIIIDYLPVRKFPIIGRGAKAMLWMGTLGTIYGLYLYNTRDIGITGGIYAAWKAKNIKMEENKNNANN